VILFTSFDIQQPTAIIKPRNSINIIKPIQRLVPGTELSVISQSN